MKPLLTPEGTTWPVKSTGCTGLTGEDFHGISKWCDDDWELNINNSKAIRSPGDWLSCSLIIMFKASLSLRPPQRLYFKPSSNWLGRWRHHLWSTKPLVVDITFLNIVHFFFCSVKQSTGAHANCHSLMRIWSKSDLLRLVLGSRPQPGSCVTLSFRLKTSQKCDCIIGWQIYFNYPEYENVYYFFLTLEMLKEGYLKKQRHWGKLVCTRTRLDEQFA